MSEWAFLCTYSFKLTTEVADKNTHLRVSHWKGIDSTFFQLLPKGFASNLPACDWLGYSQEPERTDGHSYSHLSLTHSNSNTKSLAYDWKKLFHASSTPTVMTATWGTGSQIIDLCELMGLSIHESQRATENQRNVSMWAHQHSSDYFLWLNREWLSKNLSFWFLTTLLTSQFSNFCLKIGLPFNLFISRSWMGQAIISPPGAWTGIWAFPTPLRHWWVLAHSNLLEVSLDNHKHLRGNQEPRQCVLTRFISYTKPISQDWDKWLFYLM